MSTLDPVVTEEDMRREGVAAEINERLKRVRVLQGGLTIIADALAQEAREILDMDRNRVHLTQGIRSRLDAAFGMVATLEALGITYPADLLPGLLGAGVPRCNQPNGNPQALEAAQ